jgi:integral membrane sensor domain MASE1
MSTWFYAHLDGTLLIFPLIIVLWECCQAWGRKFSHSSDSFLFGGLYSDTWRTIEPRSSLNGLASICLTAWRGLGLWGITEKNIPLTFINFPPVLWASFRFGHLGSAICKLVNCFFLYLLVFVWITLLSLSNSIRPCLSYVHELCGCPHRYQQRGRVTFASLEILAS